jgi:phage baseplate assembly protein W
MAFNLALNIVAKGTQMGIASGPINWNPDQGSAEEIIQNVKMILLTPIFSQVLDRRLGVNMNFLDLPQNKGMALMRFSMSLAIQVFEPRFVVEQILFNGVAGDPGTVVANILGHLATSVIAPSTFNPVLGSGTITYIVTTDLNGNPLVNTALVSS